MSDKKISDFAIIGSLQNNVFAALYDPNEVDPLLQNKRAAMSQFLDFIQKINQSVGFTLAGGTTSKTLTLTENCTIDQNLSKTASVLFQGVTSKKDYLTGQTPDQLILGVLANSDHARIGYNSVDGYTSIQSQGTNPIALNPLGGWVGINGITSPQFPLSVAGSGIFYGNLYLFQDPQELIMTMDSVNNVADIQANHFGVGYNQLNLNSAGGNVGVGLAVTQAANARLHSSVSTILGLANSAVSDGNLYNSNLNFWLDETNTILNFKTKNSSGAVQTFSITPSGGDLWEQFASGGNQYLRPRTALGINAVQANRGLFGITPNAYVGTQISNLFVMNSSNADEQLNIVYDGTNDVGSIQSIHQGVGFTPLMLQSSGGPTGVALPNNHAFTTFFEVGGTSKFLDNVSIQNGMQIADAGGGIQFNDTGNMTVDTGVSFFVSNQYYRIGFDNFNATRGWIRQNVDSADAIHGFAWSAGVVTNPINALMILQGDGKFLLGASAQSLSAQSLSNIFGDIYLSSISSPSTPTSGVKTYAKVVSGTSHYFAKTSDGTEYQLTGAAATENFWEQTTINSLSAIRPKSSLANNLIAVTNGSTTATLTAFGYSSGGISYIQPQSGATPTYENLILSPLGGNVGVGLSLSEPPNASLHSNGSTILGSSNAAVADGSLYTLNTNIWLDEVNTVLKFKVKDSSSVVRTYQLGVSPFGPVTSVFGRGGAVVGTASDYTGVVAFTAFSYVAQGIGDPNKQLSIGFDETNNHGTIQATIVGTGQVDLKLNASGGNVGVGISPATTIQSKLDVAGGISISQISTPSTPRSNSATFYVKSDKIAYFMADTGQEKAITSANKRTSTTVDSNGPNDYIISLNSTTGSNLFVVDISQIREPLIISWTSGSNVPQVQAAAGQTINGISTPISLGTRYTSMTVVPAEGSSTAGVIVSSAVG